MIRKILAVSIVALTASTSVPAADWLHVAAVESGTISLDRSSIVETGNFQSIQVLRDYTRIITLGSDPDTKEAWYPHRSVQLSYLADCGTRTVAMEAWKMYSGNFGNGEIVWADRFTGMPTFAAPGTTEESAALNNACAANKAVSSLSSAL